MHNGNYLGIIELLAEHDTFLAEHIQRRANKGKGHVSYLSSTICNEFIELLWQEVQQHIVSEVKAAKYYSISVDSTLDIAHTDQLTVILRYVLQDCPVERFVRFLLIHGHTGAELANVLLYFLHDTGIDIADCRGQSYDNPSKMSGKYNGMHALIREKNNLVEYVPCCAHSLNLVGKCAVDCCTEAVLFFNCVPKIYVFFSASTHRWKILSDDLERSGTPTVKRLSDTRWSAHSDAIRALKMGYTDIKNLLEVISEDEEEKADARLEAKGLFSMMDQLETGIMVELWSTILERFNKTSKQLQNPKLDLNSATQMLESLKTFVQKIRPLFELFHLQTGTIEETQKEHKMGPWRRWGCRSIAV